MGRYNKMNCFPFDSLSIELYSNLIGALSDFSRIFKDDCPCRILKFKVINKNEEQDEGGRETVGL